ncbi:hypothetical protein GCM10009843_15630 [Nocardioides bigeumensis]|uniref:Uncharacterized protein n=1 Tax=Nocardioides bigeumensis TaxID=433657 RepID=A0ABN2Y650_9ACTN
MFSAAAPGFWWSRSLFCWAVGGGNLLVRLRGGPPQTWDDHELACAWRDTTVALRLARPHQCLGLVQLRAGHLDEMVRRSPAGMQA